MRLTVWDPFREFAALEKVMDSLLRRPYTRSAYPPIELIEKDNNVVVSAQIPGLEKDAIELTVLGDTLTIAGEKKLPTEENVRYIRHERPHGKFHRQIDLPCTIEQDKISATYKDGILTITLPKAEEVKPRQIAVE